MTVALRAKTETADIDRYRRLVREGTAEPHGYTALLGERRADLDTPTLVAMVESGLPYRSLERFRRNLDLPMPRLAEVVRIRPRTLSRRKRSGRLEADESDRLLRASRVFGRSLALFETDAEAARAWLRRPAPALGGAVPLDLLGTEVGARDVETLIERLEHGVFT